MTGYTLTALLKLREHKKTAAECSLKEAYYQHGVEKQRLEQLQVSLNDTIALRAKLQDNFFLKARRKPSNQREINCHISSSKKSLQNENQLRKTIDEQQEIVRCASLKLEIAKTSLIDAHKNLKLIEKHYASWQQRQRRAEHIKEEYDNDDQNSVRFLLRKA